jgi:hypothetical protein
VHEQRQRRLPDRHALTSHKSDRSQGHRPWLRRFSGPILVALIALTVVAPVSGHEGQPLGIALSAERLPPGAPLEVIGQDFLPGETLAARMSGPGGTWQLGQVRTGADGHFAVVFTVPVDATPGPYAVDAVAISGIIARADFEVDAAAPRPALTPTPAEVAVAGDPAVDDQVWIYAPLVLVGAGLLGFWLFARRRRPS